MRARLRGLIRPALAVLVLALLAAAVIPWTPLRDSILDLGDHGSTAPSEASVQLDLTQCIAVARAKGYDVTGLERARAWLDEPEEPLSEDVRLDILEWLLETCRQITG